MFIPNATVDGIPLPTPSATSIPPPPIPNYSLIIGLLSLAGVTIAQPPQTLFYAKHLDSRLLRISPIFCGLDLLLSIISLLIAFYNGLSLPAAARSVILFRAVTDDAHRSGGEAVEPRVEAVVRGYRFTRLLAFFAALSQVVKLFGMHGVAMERAAGVAMGSCAVATELIPMLANWGAPSVNGDNGGWWRSDVLDPRVIAISVKLRKWRKEQWWLLVLVEFATLVVHTLPAVYWTGKWYFWFLDVVASHLPGSNPETSLDKSIPEWAWWVILGWFSSPYFIWSTVMGLVVLLMWEGAPWPTPERLVDVLLYIAGFMLFDFPDHDWRNAPLLSSAIRALGLVTAFLVAWLPTGVFAVFFVGIALICMIVTLGIPAAALGLWYWGLGWVLRKVAGRERDSPGSVIRSRRVFMVQTLVTAVWYYCGVYTGVGTWREEWTEKLG